MKKLFILFAVSGFLISCGNNAPKQEDPFEAKKIANEKFLAEHPEIAKGKDLIAKNNCLTCHKVDTKLIGPAYNDVAAKYAGMPDTIVAHLASKVIAGGKGVWGDAVMTPHPTVSQEDAETMVKYVLSLK